MVAVGRSHIVGRPVFEVDRDVQLASHIQRPRLRSKADELFEVSRAHLIREVKDAAMASK